MINIHYVTHDGETFDGHGTVGETVMSVAVDNSIPGIDGDCGGCCCCATCHVYVDKRWMSKTGRPSLEEEALLKLNEERALNSRLACQLELTEELDGLTVELPEFQF